jgi:hypothetical protein
LEILDEFLYQIFKDQPKDEIEIDYLCHLFYFKWSIMEYLLELWGVTLKSFFPKLEERTKALIFKYMAKWGGQSIAKVAEQLDLTKFEVIQLLFPPSIISLWEEECMKDAVKSIQEAVELDDGQRQNLAYAGISCFLQTDKHLDRK